MVKTKEEWLKENGWEEFIGFCFPSPRAENDFELTFVEKEEALKVISEGVKSYWWNESHEQLYELDTAWEYFTEDYCDKHNLNPKSQKEIDNILLK